MLQNMRGGVLSLWRKLCLGLVIAANRFYQAFIGTLVFCDTPFWRRVWFRISLYLFGRLSLLATPATIMYDGKKYIFKYNKGNFYITIKKDVGEIIKLKRITSVNFYEIINDIY